MHHDSSGLWRGFHDPLILPVKLTSSLSWSFCNPSARCGFNLLIRFRNPVPVTSSRKTEGWFRQARLWWRRWWIGLGCRRWWCGFSFRRDGWTTESWGSRWCWWLWWWRWKSQCVHIIWLVMQWNEKMNCNCKFLKKCVHIIWRDAMKRKNEL